MKYKSWLVKKYKEQSLDTVIGLLEDDQPLSELAFTSFFQKEGARVYRKQLKRINKSKGQAEVQKYLSK